MVALAPGETRLQRMRKLVNQLKSEYRSKGWADAHDEICRFMMPYASRLDGDVTQQANRGDMRMTEILDATATKDLNIAAAGMMMGTTSPASDWFQLATPDDDLNQYAPVKRWLEDADERLSNLFRSSNLYNVLPEAFLDLFGLGTMCVGMQEDDADVFRFAAYPIGTYWLAADGRGVVDTCVRQYAYTVRQLVTTFGEKNCSDNVRKMYADGNREHLVAVMQVITPNDQYRPRSGIGRFKQWASCHFEVAAPQDSEQFLKESGFDEFPILAGRYSTRGDNVYGHGLGHLVLPDVKELQFLKRRKANAVDKAIDPPWLVSAEMASGQLDLRPGATNYYSKMGTGGASPAVPLYQAGALSIGEVRQDIADVQRAIHSGLYADLFMMLANDQRAQPPTAAEIYARQEEKMLGLGPVLERLYDEVHDPMVGRGFAMMARRGLLPPAPRELQGMALTVRYVSVMAKAQKMAGLAAQERLIGHIGMLAQMDPSVLDKVNFDRDIDMYADKVGASAKMVRSDEEVAVIRKQRAQQQQQAQAIANAQAGAKAARDLATAPLDTDNALVALAGRPING